MFVSWRFDELTPDQALRYEVKDSGGTGIHSGRTRFSVKCVGCGEVLHQGTTNPSSYIKQHDKLCLCAGNWV